MTTPYRGPVLALLTLTAACASTPAAEPHWTPLPAPYTEHTADDRHVPWSEWGPGREIASLNLPPLRDVDLPPGWAEIRLWTYRGIAVPNEVVRLVQAPGGTRGGSYALWRVPPDVPQLRERLPDLYTDQEWEHVPRESFLRSYGCRIAHTVDGAVACSVDYAVPVDWNDVVERLWSAGIDRIVDPDSLPGFGSAINDDTSLAGEILIGDEYRAWWWSSGDTRYWPEEGALVRAVKDILADVRMNVRPNPGPAEDAAGEVHAALLRHVLALEYYSGAVRICVARRGGPPATPPAAVMDRLAAAFPNVSEFRPCDWTYVDPEPHEQVVFIDRLYWRMSNAVRATHRVWEEDRWKYGWCDAVRSGDGWALTCQGPPPHPA